MNAFVPCNSLTPKSASKLSVMVYHGMAQPIRAFALDVWLGRARGERKLGIGIASDSSLVLLQRRVNYFC
jgi:hypothetical protein